MPVSLRRKTRRKSSHYNYVQCLLQWVFRSPQTPNINTYSTYKMALLCVLYILLDVKFISAGANSDYVVSIILCEVLRMTNLIRIMVAIFTIMSYFRVMKNAKALGEKLQEATKSSGKVVREYSQINMQFRTMDKDINTVRPLLMKLQREKDQYTRYAHVHVLFWILLYLLECYNLM